MFVKASLVRIAGSAIFSALLWFGIVGQKGYFFEDDPATLSRAIYEFNPFPESKEIAGFIEESTSETDRVAVFGSEPQIFFMQKDIQRPGTSICMLSWKCILTA